MLDEKSLLLLTKLHRPRPPRNLVVRTRLVEWLNQNIDHHLTLVCAPAGFGKTTLVSTWLEHMAAGHMEKAPSLPSAWLSLDDKDSDLNLFLHYFIVALRTIFKEACPETLALLQAQQPPERVLYAKFCNELEELPGELILVLDDYHTIHGVVVHNLLSELARHWPEPLHLVLISRTNPPVPLTRLRVKGKITEIYGSDLRFTSEETAAYLSQVQFGPLNQNALSLVEKRFEGWIAGLHLAALSLRSTVSQEALLSALSGENAYITAYLLDEVLAGLIPAIQSFLLKSSILDRLCASLCDAIFGETDANWNARACLDWIEHSELFIIPLDQHREWYRYHHLFQELLMQRLFAEMKADDVSNLHRSASAWYEEHGLIDEALHHAIAAGDIDLAARQMIGGVRDVLNREDRPRLERWLGLLPDEIIQRNPRLLMIKAFALQFLWRHDLQAKVLQQVEELLDSDAGASLPVNDLQILRGSLFMLRAQYAYFSNQNTRGIDLCHQALALLPRSWITVRGGAIIYLGLFMQADGQVLAVERLLLDEYEIQASQTDNFSLFPLQSLSFIYLNTGQFDKTVQIAQTLLQRATRSGMPLMKHWGEWFLGVVWYQRNELEAATETFASIFENRYIAEISPYRDAVAGLVLIHQIHGESVEAWQKVESISQYDLEQRGSEDNRTRSLRARLMLLQGDLEGAGNWVDTFTEPPPDQPLLWFDEPQVTRARILVARGTDADLRSALQVLDVLNEITDRTHNTRYKIEVLALGALALEAQGETSQADAALEQAVDLARLGGFIRVFVDLGKPMQEILHRLAKQDRSAGMIRRILGAFPEDDKNQVKSESQAKSRRHTPIRNSTLAEPLTQRELEILTLLREPLSNKEIARKLNISYATIKSHTNSLYAKLGVNRRWDAVARALEIGILPPS